MVKKNLPARLGQHCQVLGQKRRGQAEQRAEESILAEGGPRAGMGRCSKLEASMRAAGPRAGSTLAGL